MTKRSQTKLSGEWMNENKGEERYLEMIKDGKRERDRERERENLRRRRKRISLILMKLEDELV